MIAKGPFDVKMNAEPPFDVVDGVALGRATFDKRFHGPLAATSVVHFLSVRAPSGAAAYVALERVSGALEGREGTFVLAHYAVADSSGSSLTVQVAPGSGTGALAGLAGTMRIAIQEGGAHFYELDYTL